MGIEDIDGLTPLDLEQPNPLPEGDDGELALEFLEGFQLGYLSGYESGIDHGYRNCLIRLQGLASDKYNDALDAIITHLIGE